MNKRAKVISLISALFLGLIAYYSRFSWTELQQDQRSENGNYRPSHKKGERGRERSLQKPVAPKTSTTESDVLLVGGKKWHLDMGDIDVDSKQKASIYQDINRVMRFKKNPEVTPLLVKFELRDGRQLDRRVTFVDGAGVYPASFRSEYCFAGTPKYSNFLSINGLRDAV